MLKKLCCENTSLPAIMQHSAPSTITTSGVVPAELLGARLSERDDDLERPAAGGSATATAPSLLLLGAATAGAASKHGIDGASWGAEALGAAALALPLLWLATGTTASAGDALLPLRFLFFLDLRSEELRAAGGWLGPATSELERCCCCCSPLTLLDCDPLLLPASRVAAQCEL